MVSSSGEFNAFLARRTMRRAAWIMSIVSVLMILYNLFIDKLPPAIVILAATGAVAVVGPLIILCSVSIQQYLRWFSSLMLIGAFFAPLGRSFAHLYCESAPENHCDPPMEFTVRELVLVVLTPYFYSAFFSVTWKPLFMASCSRFVYHVVWIHPLVDADLRDDVLSTYLVFGVIFPVFVCHTHDSMIERCFQLYLQKESAREAAVVATDEAKQAESTKEEFMRYVFHELRVPFNAVSLAVDNAQDIIEDEFPTGVHGSDDTESKDDRPEAVHDVMEMLVVAQVNCDTMTRLLDDVLSFAAISAGKFQVLPERFSVPEAVDSLVATATALASRNDRVLTFEIKESCPEFIIADWTRLGQVLRNFISNAMKFTRSNGKIHLVVEGIVDRLIVAETPAEDNSVSSANTVRFAVTDNGVGISEEGQKKLFQPYQQVDSGSKKACSTGLGLAISRHIIVEQHFGRIGVDSRLGSGSTFFFQVPVNPPSSPAGSMAVSSQSKGRTSGRTSKENSIRSVSRGRAALSNAQRLANSSIGRLLTPVQELFARRTANRRRVTPVPNEDDLEYVMRVVKDRGVVPNERMTSSAKLRINSKQRRKQSASLPRTVSTTGRTSDRSHFGSWRTVSLSRFSLKRAAPRLSSRRAEPEPVHENDAVSAHDASPCSTIAEMPRRVRVVCPGATLGRSPVSGGEHRTKWASVILGCEARYTGSPCSEESSFSMRYKAVSLTELLEGKHVLVVEDSVASWKMMKVFLTRHCANAIHAHHGQEALELMEQSGEFDLILMDREMPVMNGLDATRELRSRGASLPIFGLTGAAMDSEVSEFISSGADGVIAKPLKADKLKAMLVGYATAAGCNPANAAPQSYRKHSKSSLYNGQHGPLTGTPRSAPAGEFLRQLLSGIHVLIVEDQKSSANMLRMFLKRHGATSEIAVNGQAAINMIRARHDLSSSTDDLGHTHEAKSDPDYMDSGPFLPKECLTTWKGRDVSSGRHSVETVRSPDERLAALPHKPFDFVIMDKEMPVMDGPTAVRYLREMGLSIPIFGLTGSALDADQNMLRDAGANDVTTKPLRREALHSMLMQVFPDRSQTREPSPTRTAVRIWAEGSPSRASSGIHSQPVPAPAPPASSS